jgi:hypothetical protein
LLFLGRGYEGCGQVEAAGGKFLGKCG